MGSSACVIGCPDSLGLVSVWRWDVKVHSRSDQSHGASYPHVPDVRLSPSVDVCYVNVRL